MGAGECGGGVEQERWGGGGMAQGRRWGEGEVGCGREGGGVKQARRWGGAGEEGRVERRWVGERREGG